MFQVEQSKVLIKEGGVQLTLTIVDTPGFGDAVDNSNWCVGIYQVITCSRHHSILVSEVFSLSFQLAASHKLHRQQVRGLPECRVQGEPQIHARQQSALLPILHCTIWTRVCAAVMMEL